jgi:hypothetical protein
VLGLMKGFYLDNGVGSCLISTARLYMFLDADAPCQDREGRRRRGHSRDRLGCHSSKRKQEHLGYKLTVVRITLAVWPFPRFSYLCHY